MQFLKADTAVTIKFGPFVDDSDGKTAETGLTISQADIRLSKNGGDFAQTNNAAGATHDENGYYDIPLDTTDTNTEGRLKVAVSESGALPVWAEFMVVNANVFDSLFAAGTTDYLQVDMLQIGGVTQSQADLKDFADAGYNPATNKVQGVVLVDTTTTNTDMVGTDGANTTVPDAAGTASSLHTTTDAKIDGLETHGDGAWATAVGFSTHAAADIWSVGTRTLTSFGTLVTDIWHQLLSAITTAGSIGKKLKDMGVGADNKVLISTDAQDLSGSLDVNTKLIEGSDATDQINSAVDDALDTAIPGSPTANSLNERVKAIDDKLPSKDYLAGTANSDGDVQMDEATGNFGGSVASVAGAVASVSGNVDGNVTGSLGSLATQAKADVNAEVDTALDTAIPGSPTANSINERMKAIDDKLPSKTYLMGSADADGGFDTEAKSDINAEVDTAFNTAIPGSPTANSINERVKAMDDKLPSKNYLTGTANSDGDIEMNESTGDFTSTQKTAIKAEVLEVVNVDTFAEIGQEAPSATQTIRKMIGYLYKQFRNKETQTRSQYSLYNDAGDTIDQKSTRSDDSTTFTKGEIGTGP